MAGECNECCDIRRRNHGRTKNGLITQIYSNQKRRSKIRNHPAPPSYTKEELKEWLYSQKRFHELFDQWKASGFKKDLFPSCDRLDDYKSYSLDNLRLVTWEENNRKGHEDRKAGLNNKGSKAVVGVHMETGERFQFYSISEASRKTSTNIGNISSSIEGKRKTAGGYVWEFCDN